MTSPRLPFAGAALLLVLSGCNHPFAFRQDRRVHIVSPNNNATLGQPLTVTWTAKDTNGEAFAVFVDHAPIAAGAGVRSIGRSDPQCRQDPSCPDAAYLAQRNVFVTTGNALELPRLPDRRTHPGDKDQHDVTIVLVNQDAQRVGEAAYTVTFEIAHPST